MGMNLTILLHLVPKLRKIQLYLTPLHVFMAWCLINQVQEQLHFL